MNAPLPLAFLSDYISNLTNCRFSVTYCGKFLQKFIFGKHNFGVGYVDLFLRAFQRRSVDSILRI